MALQQASRFGRVEFRADLGVVCRGLTPALGELNAGGWVYAGFAPAPVINGLAAPLADLAGPVDGSLRLESTLGFEQVPAIVTAGLRSSRFAPLLYWELLHALTPGGIWVDIDHDHACHGTALSGEDILQRRYFSEVLSIRSTTMSGGIRCQVLHKTVPTLNASSPDGGWTFGILTAGPSPRAAQMARDILALNLPQVEVIFCGPTPDGAPQDPRVRAIDLDVPEPRGWITRKKNLIAREARHENLCLLHDRYRITPAWAEALQGTGRTRAVSTFPQIFAVDRDRRFTQRYADYQVLHQQSGIEDALAARVFAGEHVLYAPYDDFADTAFCCGGLYVTSRSVWTRVLQDEGLYHGEWEDVVFGLECQRQGIPHRVDARLVVESLLPHPMALTRMHELSAAGTPELGRLHVAPSQATEGAKAPSRFTPVVATTRDGYYDKVRRRFNAIPWLAASDHLRESDVEGCSGLADFWHVVERRVNRLPYRDRSDIASVVHFLSDSIYNWPNCELLSWIRDNEWAHCTAAQPLARFSTVVGWGTGSLFQSSHRLIGRHLDLLVDSDSLRWGTRIEGYDVQPPEVLDSVDPATTAVVVFSCAFDAIASDVAARGPFMVMRASDAAIERRFRPLCDMTAYFEEVERHYPVVFAPPVCEGVRA